MDYPRLDFNNLGTDGLTNGHWYLFSRYGDSRLKNVEFLQVNHLVYVFYGSIAILCWKCGTQLQKEIKHVITEPFRNEVKTVTKTKFGKK